MFYLWVEAFLLCCIHSSFSNFTLWRTKISGNPKFGVLRRIEVHIKLYKAENFKLGY